MRHRVLQCFFIVAIALVSCKPETDLPDRGVSREEHRSWAIGIANDIAYIYDARADICFAYTYRTNGGGNSGTGGPALATVDCAKVEVFLLNPPPFKSFTPAPPAEAPVPLMTAP